MKTYRIGGKIVTSYRLNNSVNGNPRWHFLLLADTGVYEFKTRTDAKVGYLFRPYVYTEAVVDYHITSKGNLICDDITFGTYKGVV